MMIEPSDIIYYSIQFYTESEPRWRFRLTQKSARHSKNQNIRQNQNWRIISLEPT